MPKKPNYRFERSEREKAKALKKAERLRAKAERSEARKNAAADGNADGPETDRSGS